MNQAASEAVSRLQRASGWRKKELQTLQSAMPVIGVSSRFNVMRGSLVLLCAHCEGFLREATTIFLRYLEDRSPDLADVRENYIILLKPDGLARPWQAARDQLLGDTARRPRMLGDLRRHLWLLGLDYPPFEAQEKPLGELVRLRNEIAHGEKRWLSDDNYSEHTRRALTFIDTLEDESRSRPWLSAFSAQRPSPGSRVVPTSATRWPLSWVWKALRPLCMTSSR